MSGYANPQLVQQVKEWQRKSSNHKQAWDNFCREAGSSKLDPSKKDNEFLQSFLEAAEQGMITVEESGPPSGEKEDLVNQVKQWQRRGEGHKLAWWDWCKQQGTQDYDPNRHDPGFLQQFLSDCHSGVIQVQGDSKGKGKGKDKGKGKGKGGWEGGWDDGYGRSSAPIPRAHVQAARKGGWQDEEPQGWGGKGGKAPKGGKGGNGPKIGEIRFDDPDDAAVAIDHLNGSYFEDSQITVEMDPASTDGTKLVVKGLPPHAQWQELKDHFKEVGVVAYAGFRDEFAGSFESRAPYSPSSKGDGGKGYGGGKGHGDGKGSFGKDSYGKDSYGKGGGGKDSYGKGGGGKDSYGKGGGGFRDGFGKGGGGQGGDKVGEIRYDDPQHAQEAVDYLNGSELEGRMITVEFDPREQSGMGTKLVVGNLPSGMQWQELKDHFKQIGTVAYAGFKSDKGYGPMKGARAPERRGPY